MIITKTIHSDLLIKGPVQEIHAVQGDRYTRKVVLRLHANKVPWATEAPVSAAIRYRKPDGTGGIYDTLPNGEIAWELDGNALSFLLAPQMLTVPGKVAVQVELRQGDSILATFPLEVVVEKDPAIGVAKSRDYMNWQEHLAEKLAETLARLKKDSAFDDFTPKLEIGSVVTLPNGQPADAQLRGTVKNPILDLYLPRGETAATDSTLSQPQHPADAKAVGDALAEKAPGGYGLGTGAVSVSSFNIHNGCGFIEGTEDAPYSSDWAGIHVAFGDNLEYGYQEVVDALLYPNTKARRYKVGGEWSQWEFENPPSVFGVEYATTERWNGKVVYTTLFDCGTITGGGSCALPYTCKQTIRYTATDGTGTLPFIFGTMTDQFTCWSALTASKNLLIYDNRKIGHTITCQVWYVKD